MTTFLLLYQTEKNKLKNIRFDSTTKTKQKRRLFAASRNSYGPRCPIRTGDPLVPNQMRYQTALNVDIGALYQNRTDIGGLQNRCINHYTKRAEEMVGFGPTPDITAR